MDINELLLYLFEGKPLTQQQSKHLFTAIINGELLNEQLSAALIALKLRGETTEEITGAVYAALENAEFFPSPNYEFADIVGTGGDGANTINISTASAIVAAAAGFKVAKHGNRSVSSKSGSSDVLNALGIKIDMDANTARKALDEINLCFLWAQQYHTGFKHVAYVRQLLKTRTIFNILGPLCNPARPPYQLLGVYSADLIQPYAETVARLGHKHTIVVHGAGLDEVAIHSKTDVAEIRDGKIARYILSPRDFGLKSQPLESLRGDDPNENAKILTALLKGKGKTAHVQAVAMNTALLMKLFGHDDLKQNTMQIIELINSGKAFETLEKLIAY